MKTAILFSMIVLLGACGKKSSFEEENAPQDQNTCTIVESTMMCPDGTEYELPGEVIIEIEGTVDVDLFYDIVIIETVETTEDDPEAICESNNRNGKKCRKLKKGKKK